MIMNSNALSLSIAAPSGKRVEYIQNIRMGSRSFSYQPCKYVTDDDWTEILALFKKVVDHRKQLSFMAHMNHPRERSPNQESISTFKVYR